MKKPKPIVEKIYFKVKDCIFNQVIHILINHSHKDFAEFARKKGATDFKDDDSVDKNFAGFSTILESLDNNPNEYVILVNKFDWTIKEQNTLIHEIVHTIIKIWHSNNIPFNNDTQEFLAHSIGNLYEDIAANIFKKTKKPLN